MKKLLISTDNFLPRWDGIARFLSEIIPKLKDKFEITVIAPKFQGKIPKYNGVNIIRIPLSGTQFGDYPPAKFEYRKIEAIVKENDLVFNQTIGPIGLAAILAAKKHKVPVASYIHSIEWDLFSKAVKRFKGIIYKTSRTFARYCYKRCKLLILPSPDVARIMKENKIRTNSKVVPLGTDVAKFIPAINKNKAKKKIKINPRYKVIGFCGRIGREKDLTTLYNAFSKLSKLRTDIKLLIIGSGLKETEKSLLKEKNIILTGSKDNVVPYLQAMDIYVLPSLTETTSISTLEAMSCGLPVIVTPVGYVKHYVKDNKNGMFFPKKNSGILAKKINLLLKSENLRWRLGESARKTIVKKFSWEKTVKNLEKVLKSLS